MTKKAPGRSDRKGITLFELQQMFPNEEAAREWWEAIIWPNGDRFCPDCGSTNTRACPAERMPYRCNDCKQYFSVKKATVMRGSNVPLLKWTYAVYLDVASLKGIASMKLYRQIGVTQKTAWYMQQRIREAFADQGPRVLMQGPVEVDETSVGGLVKNMSKQKRKEHKGTGFSGKVIVAGAKDRASGEISAAVVKGTSRDDLHGFIQERVDPRATVYTDEHKGYTQLPMPHEQVHHGRSEYVRGDVHTQGIESFWAMLKRAHKGTFHKISKKHLQRYVNEFAGRHNIRDLDTAAQMAYVARKLVGKRLPYAELIAD